MIPLPEEQPTMTVEEVAAALRLSRASAYRAISRGEIPSIRLGRRLVVPTAALRDMLFLRVATSEAAVAHRAQVDKALEALERWVATHG
jgi:excisionase family DNA binding protein